MYLDVNDQLFIYKNSKKKKKKLVLDMSSIEGDDVFSWDFLWYQVITHFGSKIKYLWKHYFSFQKTKKKKSEVALLTNKNDEIFSSEMDHFGWLKTPIE